MKNYTSFLAIVNHWNWLDDSPPLRHNNTFTTNPTLIANNFNDYFSDIAKALAHQLKPFSESEHTKYLTKRLHQSLFLTPTTSFEVFNLISGLKNTKSTGKDDVSAYFLKVAAKVIAAPLAQLFNYTFLLGIFPASLKIAKIILIYKSGDKSDVSYLSTDIYTFPNF